MQINIHVIWHPNCCHDSIRYQGRIMWRWLMTFCLATPLKWAFTIPLGPVAVVRTWLHVMTSILNEIKGETAQCHFSGRKKDYRIIRLLCFMFPTLGIRILLQLCFCVSKVLAIKQGGAIAPWPLFQFGLNCLCSVWAFFWWRGLYGHIFPKFNFSRWLSDCDGQPLSLGQLLQSPFFNLKTSWRIKERIKQTNPYSGIMLSWGQWRNFHSEWAAVADAGAYSVVILWCFI